MNLAAKIGTLLIVTLSLLISVEGLTCNVCEFSKNSRCRSGQDRCHAKHGQSCATISQFYGSRHLSSKQLCMFNCKERQIYHKKKLTYYMCCDKNLCNSF
ncbi:Pate4 [Phodopus roborovskii]|uniref:Pate4 protein n=1 Tax=Phodopus roborovskii TaxID=109678 RepID=A0AAU9ZSA7_PHORO|nr:Pate4 [Phodopus roborovskii]